MKTKITVATVILAAAGVYIYATDQYRTVPSDLRDAVADSDSFKSDLAGIKGNAADAQIPPAPGPEAASPGVSAGDRVIHAKLGAGTVKEVFSNGIAHVRFDSGLSYTPHNTKELGVGVDCFKEVCKKGRVIDTRDVPGTVAEVFTNGVACVRFDNSLSCIPQKITELGVGVKCHKDICKNSRVIRSGNVPGTVKEIFTNGVAYVRFDNGLSYTPHKAAELGVGVDCFKGICKKDRIIDTRNVPGTVVEIFTNGITRVLFDNGLDSQYINITALGRK